MDNNKERVARGAAWLDQVRPDWFLEVNPRTLTLGLGCMTRCVIAQIGRGDFRRGLFMLPRRPEWGLDTHGFNLGSEEIHKLTTVRRMNRAWRKEIKRRRKAYQLEQKYLYEVPPIEVQLEELFRDVPARLPRA